MHSTCPIHLILHDSVLIMFKEITGWGPSVQVGILPMKMGTVRRTASSVTSYQPTPRGIEEERKFEPRRVRSQKSHGVNLKLLNSINNELLQANRLYSVIFIPTIAQQPGAPYYRGYTIMLL